MKNILFFMIIMIFGYASSGFAKPGFEGWVTEFKQQARETGISQKTLDEAFSEVRHLDRVIELDRKQPEGRLSFAQYKAKVINQNRIDEGRRMYRQHRELLEQVAGKYGVPAPYIVALWGVETSYGNNTGGFHVVEALATLAYDGRRSGFFRKELLKALKIIDEGHISVSRMKGSWAGAMGQNQFMPSSFFAFAVDGNNDGRRDIWNTLPDVFASTANYLHKSGWEADQRWGRRVQLPEGFSVAQLGLETKKTIAQWSSMGVRLPDGEALPMADIKASIIRPDKNSGPAFMVYDNYRVIMKWNKSVYFATSVGLLADAIAAGG